MESEVLRVKHGISNNLNQLQFISIVDVWHSPCQITVFVTLYGTKAIDKNWTLNHNKKSYQATLYKSPLE